MIPEGSGQVGRLLGRAFDADRHEVATLSRKSINAPWHMVSWDGETIGDWAAAAIELIDDWRSLEGK